MVFTFYKKKKKKKKRLKKESIKLGQGRDLILKYGDQTKDSNNYLTNTIEISFLFIYRSDRGQLTPSPLPLHSSATGYILIIARKTTGQARFTQYLLHQIQTLQWKCHFHLSMFKTKVRVKAHVNF